jgi:hypothetical protein
LLRHRDLLPKWNRVVGTRAGCRSTTEKVLPDDLKTSDTFSKAITSEERAACGGLSARHFIGLSSDTC